MTVFDLPDVTDLIHKALAEDLGVGDLTTRLTVPAGTRGRGEITAKEQMIIAGLPLVRKVCDACGGGVRVEECVDEASPVAPQMTVARLSGPAATLLAAERVTLNLMQHLSGIATTTADYVAAVAGYGCRIVDTRKTIPGMRGLQKYAVRCGGGFNHRIRLDDGILIKDNHIAASGGVSGAVMAALAGAPHGVKVEVECVSLSEVREALAAGAEAILLDNMGLEDMRTAVRMVAGRATVEASGGISLDSVRDVAATGVHVISVGALTHSVRAVDLSMTLYLER
jgi:nicotinate-nucleotide pyrophosphorylase (carboxylating)